MPRNSGNPASTNVASCDRILAAAKQAGTVFMVAEQAHYWPDVRQVHQLIQDGAIGAIMTARAYFGGAGPADSSGPKPWR